MNAERWALSATAALLRQGAALHLAATGLAVAALLHRPPIGMFLAVLATYSVEVVYAVRVGLDAHLFDRAADAEDLDGLDRGLFEAGLVSEPPRATRSVTSRIAGARRLFRAQAAAVVGVALALAASAWGPW
jgi:hypothetical protein